MQLQEDLDAVVVFGLRGVAIHDILVVLEHAEECRVVWDLVALFLYYDHMVIFLPLADWDVTLLQAVVPQVAQFALHKFDKVGDVLEVLPLAAVDYGLVVRLAVAAAAVRVVLCCIGSVDEPLLHRLQVGALDTFQQMTAKLQ